ncbi:UNVERIFIED_CONTAM: hypothetical protein HHA_217480 [Hammondia hammondi]|eukprot:XP_008889299.1 hypothetical protein HHA_217480 [Hammondia hammondi]
MSKTSRKNAKMPPSGGGKGVKRASSKREVSRVPMSMRASFQREADLRRKGKASKTATAAVSSRAEPSSSRGKREAGSGSASCESRLSRVSNSKERITHSLGKNRTKAEEKGEKVRAVCTGKQGAESRRNGGPESCRKQTIDQTGKDDDEEETTELHYDQWYDDYYKDELNLADETLLDVLVGVIKRHHGRHYYGDCLPASASSGTARSEAPQPETGHVAASEGEGKQAEEELSSLTSDALQVKKAWAFVAEDAALARALARDAASSAPASRKVSKANDRPLPRRFPRGEEAQAKGRGEEKTQGLRTRWQCFLERRSKRLEVERFVQNEIDAVEERQGVAPEERGKPKTSRGAKEESGSSSSQLGTEKRKDENPEEGGEVCSADWASQNEPDSRLQKCTLDEVEEAMDGVGGGEQNSSDPSASENAAASPTLSTEARLAEPKAKIRKTDASQSASPSDPSHKETPREDDESADEALAEKLLRNLTKSPSDDESSSPSSSSSSSTSSYAPSSPETENDANSEEESETEGPQNGETPMGAEGPATQPRSKELSKKEGSAGETEKARKLKRRKKGKWEKPRKSKEARLREKEKERARERQILESELSSKSACVGTFSTGNPQGKVQLPRAVALRPQCLYHFEGLLESELCSKYPNGVTRRGALCSGNLRVEETFEFFLLCRFLNLFPSLINVTWSFDELVSAISSPPSVAPIPARPLTAAPEAASDAMAASSTSSHADASERPSFPSFLKEFSPAGGSGPGGDAEKGEPGGVLRQILAKLFGFLGRRMTPGMSLTRMCGRYVDEKRRDGLIPSGFLWPFDYPVKVWQSCDSCGLGEKRKKRKEVAGREEEEAEREKKVGVPQEKNMGKQTEDDSRKKEDKKRGTGSGSAEGDELEGVFLETVYNPFKVCEDWGRLKSIHKLRVVRLLIEHAMSESPQINKALKGLTESELEAGFKGCDEAGRLYWIVPQCGDPTVFKLYREDPRSQQMAILCEEISALESVAEALSMDETTAGISTVLLEAHQQILVQEKQRSRELRRQKALSRQLEISNWGFVPASSRREKKVVDYTFAAYEASIEGKSSSRSSTRGVGPSCAESQRQDRSERLKARQARKEEQSAVAAIEATKKDGESEDLSEAARTENDSAPATGENVAFCDAVQKVEAKVAPPRARPPRQRPPKMAAGTIPSRQADGLGLHQEYSMAQQQRQQLLQQQHMMAVLHHHQQQKLLAQQQATAYQHGSAGNVVSERPSQAELLPGYRQTEWMEQTRHPQRQSQVSATPQQQALEMLRQRMDLLKQSLLQRKDLMPEQRQALYQQGVAQLSADFTRMNNAFAQTRDRVHTAHASQAPSARVPSDELSVSERTPIHESRERRLPVQNISSALSQLGGAPPRPHQAHAVATHHQLEAQQESRARAEAELHRQRLAMLHEQQQVLRAQQQQMLLLRQQHEQQQLARQRVVPPAPRQSAMTDVAAHLRGESGSVNVSPQPASVIHMERIAKAHASRGESLPAASEGAGSFSREGESERRFGGTHFSRDDWKSSRALSALRTVDCDGHARDSTIEMRAAMASAGTGQVGFAREVSARAAAPKPADNGHVL